MLTFLWLLMLVAGALLLAALLSVLPTGNPVRDAVIAASETPYAVPQADGPFSLLVFGGSQGARFFSDCLPPALECLPAETRARIRLVQQCRPEDMDRVRAAFERRGR